jgi:MFS family permease
MATSAAQIVGLRFVAALGMGGEWSLGVALVMEVWPDGSRAILAGLIGAAANFGYMLIAAVGLALQMNPESLRSALTAVGLSTASVDSLTAHSAWRFLMLLGATPAVLTFFIRFFVPESRRWQREKHLGSTRNWATGDLLGVCIGAAAAVFVLWLWADDRPWQIRVPGTLAALIVVTGGYLFPVVRYFRRCADTSIDGRVALRRMLLGACLSGIALLGTWAAVQIAPSWADQLAGGSEWPAKEYTQLSSAFGAIAGSLCGALLGDFVGRRWAYTLLCVGSLVSASLFFLTNNAVDGRFLAMMFVTGGFTAAFYGWLPLYLPELFPTSVRATGQGFSFNFGRVIAAIGVLQAGALIKQFGGSYPRACSLMCLIYLVGIAVIWLAPETRGKPLPE